MALPLHPEYRTMPMVWYIPPLSPVVDVLRDTGHDAEAAGSLFGAIDALRIPIGYLAELFTAGDGRRVRDVLARLATMRSFMRDVNLGREPDPKIAAAVGMTPEDIEDMHRLLAIAKYDERYVIPPATPNSATPASRHTTWRSSPAPSITRAVREWEDPGRSANHPAVRCPWPSRTSMRCGSGRPLTLSLTPLTARSG